VKCAAVHPKNFAAIKDLEHVLIQLNHDMLHQALVTPPRAV
jgi:hypothetical protein